LNDCDRVTGQCKCLPNVIGLNCEKCLSGWWNLESIYGCTSKCECDTTGTINNSSFCDIQKGTCNCLSSRRGQKCDQEQELINITIFGDETNKLPSQKILFTNIMQQMHSSSSIKTSMKMGYNTKMRETSRIIIWWIIWMCIYCY
jgi:hypothetical protein